jgi:CBS domain-containing protein
MPQTIKTPEQLLAYRPLRELLAAKGDGVHAVRPGDSIVSAMQLMADRQVGFLVVLEGKRLVGVVSERDYARKVALQDRSPGHVTVAEIMTDRVVTITPDRTIPECMALMDAHHFRHLPVVEGDTVVGVLSIRDLLRATIAHHERLIRELEVELMTLLNPNVSSY